MARVKRLVAGTIAMDIPIYPHIDRVMASKSSPDDVSNIAGGAWLSYHDP